MKYAIFVLLGFSSFACFAQDSAEYRACRDKANTQAEMTSCAGAEAKRVDAKLNSSYRTLLARVASQPEALAKIKAAERAWIAYRDSTCGFYYTKIQGTMAGPMGAACAARETARRAVLLKFFRGL